MRVGVEVGGTFTDLIVLDGSEIRVAKVPSTPASPDIGALNAIEAAGIDLTQVEDLVHGSTAATNAVLERKGAAVALFVTQGTRDVLLLQRHTRNSIYDVHYRKPTPIVDRSAVFEIEERVAADGAIVEPLDLKRAAHLIDRALASGEFVAVAICLLNSYVNPSHEQALAGILRERHADLVVTCSSDISREFREYERASTTVLSSFVQPVIERYLLRLTKTLASSGFTGRFGIMQSNGGRMPADAMARNAISALFSGPAAGVIGAIHGISDAGFRNLITLDMGGTSTDVSLVVDGEAQLASMTKIDGLPVKTPVIDIVTVGAGGGSIVWRDDGGLLRVGPESAGADPGPACYDRGGERPTMTDAHLIRGTLQAESFLGGAMAVPRSLPTPGCCRIGNSTAMLPSGPFPISPLNLAWRSRNWRTARSASLNRISCVQSSRSRPNAGMIHAIMWSSHMAGRGLCTPRGWPRNWASRPLSCRRMPACSQPPVCSIPTIFITVRAPAGFASALTASPKSRW